jgi:hypothetical protein
VTHTDGCKLGTTNNDTIGSTNQVNTDQMFGFSDWIFGEKAFESGENVDVGLTTYGGAQLGLWQIDDSISDLYSDVMLVLRAAMATRSRTTT